MLQDLDLMIKEMSDENMVALRKKAGFKIKRGKDLRQAEEALEAHIPPGVLERYRRLMKKNGRAVAPVVNNVCMGCFVKIPVSLSQKELGNRELRACDKCGIYLYWV
jgi:predicted  nucleic acid-binding Zn-ribbon protein